jgi:hypothetical protein
MDRYYNDSYESNNRSDKNQDLYRKIYEDGGYSNIEGIANIEKTNEIDISKIKELLKSREEYQHRKKYQQLLNNNEDYPRFEEPTLEDEEKNYDLNDILSKAHDERNSNDESYHSLRNTQYNILKSIKVDSDQHVNPVENDEELKELINTITSTSMLNKLGDKELSLDILDELKSSGDTIIEGSAAAANILKKAKDEDEEDTTDSIPIDKSFFTNGLKIKDDDFEDVDLKDINTNLKKNNKLIKTILIILGIVIVVGGLAIAWILLD